MAESLIQYRAARSMPATLQQCPCVQIQLVEATFGMIDHMQNACASSSRSGAMRQSRTGTKERRGHRSRNPNALRPWASIAHCFIIR